MFPKEAKLISDSLGVYEHDGLIQYIVNGLPVYCHSKKITTPFVLLRVISYIRAYAVRLTLNGLLV